MWICLCTGIWPTSRYTAGAAVFSGWWWIFFWEATCEHWSYVCDGHYVMIPMVQHHSVHTDWLTSGSTRPFSEAWLSLVLLFLPYYLVFSQFLDDAPALRFQGCSHSAIELWVTCVWGSELMTITFFSLLKLYLCWFASHLAMPMSVCTPILDEVKIDMSSAIVGFQLG